MSNQSESLRAALLRFKAKRSGAVGRQVKPTQLEDAARRPIVRNQQVVEGQNGYSAACDKAHFVDSPHRAARSRPVIET
jgi:hypothetical protein